MPRIAFLALSAARGCVYAQGRAWAGGHRWARRRGVAVLRQEGL